MREKKNKRCYPFNYITFHFKSTRKSVLILQNNIFEKKHKKKQLVTVKPVLSGHSKEDKSQVLKTSGGLIKVESISE